MPSRRTRSLHRSFSGSGPCSRELIPGFPHHPAPGQHPRSGRKWAHFYPNTVASQPVADSYCFQITICLRRSQCGVIREASSVVTASCGRLFIFVISAASWHRIVTFWSCFHHRLYNTLQANIPTYRACAEQISSIPMEACVSIIYQRYLWMNTATEGPIDNRFDDGHVETTFK